MKKKLSKTLSRIQRNQPDDTDVVDEIKKLLFRVTKQKLHFSDVNIISPIKNREAKRFT